MQKSAAALYTSIKHQKEKVKKCCLKLHQNLKYLGVNLTKEMKDP